MSLEPLQAIAVAVVGIGATGAARRCTDGRVTGVVRRRRAGGWAAVAIATRVARLVVADATIASATASCTRCRRIVGILLLLLLLLVAGVVARKRHVLEGQPLLVIVLAQDLVVEQVEAIAHAKPVVAVLAGEALQMVDIPTGPHDHFKGRYCFAARRAETSSAEKPEVVPLAEYEVGLGEEGGADLSKAAVAAGALEAVLVPQLVQRLEQEPLADGLLAARTLGTR